MKESIKKAMELLKLRKSTGVEVTVRPTGTKGSVGLCMTHCNCQCICSGPGVYVREIKVSS